MRYIRGTIEREKLQSSGPLLCILLFIKSITEAHLYSIMRTVSWGEGESGREKRSDCVCVADADKVGGRESVRVDGGLDQPGGLFFVPELLSINTQFVHFNNGFIFLLDALFPYRDLCLVSVKDFAGKLIIQPIVCGF